MSETALIFLMKGLSRALFNSVSHLERKTERYFTHKNDSRPSVIFSSFLSSAEMTVKERTDSSVVYAMKVRRALADGNFRRYFYLASIGPHSTKHLCEIFEPRMRMLALVCMAK